MARRSVNQPHPDYVYKVLRARSALPHMFRVPMASVGIYREGDLVESILMPRHLIKGSRRGDEVIFESIITERAG
jgi:hypothetical protein